MAISKYGVASISIMHGNISINLMVGESISQQAMAILPLTLFLLPASELCDLHPTHCFYLPVLCYPDRRPQ